MKMGTDSGCDQVIFATGGYDHTIRLWQAHSGICQRTVQHPDSQVNALEITPDRQFLAAAGYQHIRMYDINSTNPNPVINYEGISKNVTAVGFQEDGRWMFTGGEDFCARIWDIRSRSPQCQRVYQTNASVNTVRLHPNQVEMFIGDQSGVIYVWDLRNDQNEQLITDSDISIQHLDIDPEGNYLSAVDNKGHCYLFSLNKSQNSQASQPSRRLKMIAHRKYALKCKFSPDSTLLVTTSADTTARVWRTADLQPLMDQKDGLSPLSSVTGPSVVNVRGWKTAELTPSMELKDNSQRWVWDLAFSSDAQFLLTASSDNMARLWSLGDGEVKREFSGHQKALTALAFRDGA